MAKAPGCSNQSPPPVGVFSLPQWFAQHSATTAASLIDPSKPPSVPHGRSPSRLTRWYVHEPPRSRLGYAVLFYLPALFLCGTVCLLAPRVAGAHPVWGLAGLKMTLASALLGELYSDKLVAGKRDTGSCSYATCTTRPTRLCCTCART